ncbi:hypothetical protein Blue_024 [Bacillus phage Deep Blue]|uniref:Uncharacterized protein n=1 Tax=Bacillus phage Deep Blue TaxID=1792245 RepID=A0A140HLI5_9CAUD|nr:ocr-like anti-restriction [Bacillus phage Deep Blue]AMO25847.1 hypothetical protein Blue_024 [Bacillus phage Deep Blue]
MTKLNNTNNYEFYNTLGDEKDVLDSFVNDYDGSTYICDAITTIADNFIPIYNHEIWNNVSKIQEHVEEAMAQGLCETPQGEQPDLIKIFQAGYYQYYTQILYDNERELYYNYAVNVFNKKLEELEASKKEGIDFEELGEELDSRLSDTDNNDTFDDIDEIVNELFEETFEKEEEGEEE